MKDNHTLLSTGAPVPKGYVCVIAGTSTRDTSSSYAPDSHLRFYQVWLMATEYDCSHQTRRKKE